MTHRIRKMPIVLAVALLAAALLSACGGSSKKNDSQGEGQQRTETVSYECKHYEFYGEGERRLVSESEVDVDERGRVIRNAEKHYSNGEELLSWEVRSFYDELNRVYYKIENDWFRGSEGSVRSAYVYDGDSTRVLYYREEHRDGSFFAEESKYDSLYDVISRRRWDSEHDVPVIKVESVINPDRTIVNCYEEDKLSSIEERTFDAETGTSTIQFYNSERKATTQATVSFGADGSVRELINDVLDEGYVCQRHRILYDDLGRIISEDVMQDGIVVESTVYFWDTGDYTIPNREVNLRIHYHLHDEMEKDREEYFIVEKHPANEADEEHYLTVLKKEKKYRWSSEQAEHPDEKDAMETTLETEFDAEGHILRRIERNWGTWVLEYDEYDHMVRKYYVADDGEKSLEEENEYTYYPKYFKKTE